MTPRYLLAAVIAALVALAGCTTDQASRSTAPAPSQGNQGTQGGQGMSQSGGSSGY
ncbi:hypothetical protein [Sinorhizobium sp. Sb3]|uniref:hypothetical protein n=1 Tax=Sinorhizobium/Ensifer group TaxID=227292 RepID=UPI000723FA2A|nr:hypothetical protein [Sinorhizobium sp. Sb3]KSV75461.1 hypothetical protein N183_22150 [Sinorhizobium sp. Sb3]